MPNREDPGCLRIAQNYSCRSTSLITIVKIKFVCFFQFGQDVLFDCHVDVDPRWNNTLKVNWLKEEKELNLTKLAYDQSIDELEENQRYSLNTRYMKLICC